MKGTDFIKQLQWKGKRVKKSKIIKLGMVAGTFLLIFISYLVPMTMAQDIFPAKDITYMCGSQPGGGFDTFARMLGPFMTKHIREVSPGAQGGAVKVKNVTGGGHAKAAVLMNEAKPDGYTVGDFNKAAVYKYTYGSEKLPFDVREFTWLAAFTRQFRVLVSKKNGPKTFAEMIDLAKKQPSLIIATPSVGDSEHLAAIWFAHVLGLPLKIVSTGGSTATVGALVRGDADLGIMTLSAVMTLIESGDVTPLTTFASSRRYLPNVPTIVELGYPKCLDLMAGTARNVIGPPNMDPKAKEILIATFKRVVADPEFQSWCKKSGNDLEPAWDKEQKEEITNYGNTIMKNLQLFQKYGL